MGNIADRLFSLLTLMVILAPILVILALIRWLTGSLGWLLEWMAFLVPLAIITTTLSFAFRSKTEKCSRCGEYLVPNFMTGGPAEMVCPVCSVGPPAKGPPCPHCGGPLRTPRAKQCPHCLSDWHETTPPDTSTPDRDQQTTTPGDS